MKFKIIQREEMRKILSLIKSDDKEMRDIAVSILDCPERMRFNAFTIIWFNCVMTVIHLSIIVWLGYKGAGYFLIPLILGFIFQILLSILHIGACMTNMERKQYDDTVKTWTE